MYLLARGTQMVVFRKPDKADKKKEVIVTVEWPTGILHWPKAGGIEDQDYLTTRLFAACLRGEQIGAARQMQK